MGVIYRQAQFDFRKQSILQRIRKLSVLQSDYTKLKSIGLALEIAGHDQLVSFQTPRRCDSSCSVCGEKLVREAILHKIKDFFVKSLHKVRSNIYIWVEIKKSRNQSKAFVRRWGCLRVVPRIWSSPTIWKFDVVNLKSLVVWCNNVEISYLIAWCLSRG